MLTGVVVAPWHHLVSHAPASGRSEMIKSTLASCQYTSTTKEDSGAFKTATVQNKQLLPVCGSLWRSCSGFLVTTLLFCALRSYFIEKSKKFPTSCCLKFVSWSYILFPTVSPLYSLLPKKCLSAKQHSPEWIWAKKRRAFHPNLWKPLSPCIAKTDRISRQPQHFQFSAIRHWGDVSTVGSYSK